MSTFTLADAPSLDDLQVFLSRAARVEEGSVRLIAGSGVLELSGNPLVADRVFTQPGIELAGRRVTEGTAAGLVLWDVGGPVRVVGASSNAELRRLVCPG